jgi:hypothetical protein
MQHELTWFTGGGEGRRGKPERMREEKVCVLRPRGGAVEERR